MRGRKSDLFIVPKKAVMTLEGRDGHLTDSSNKGCTDGRADEYSQ